MMHGAEKSGLVIVAGKPANKAEQPAPEGSAAMLNAAEPVERRAGTKGNADQQSTRRTQSRVSVSQALERIRQVARERRKERFTALFHHIGIELLAEAFCELKADAAPGVDQLTWKDYEADLGRNLEDLHDRVQRGAYRALPSRRVYIPKPDGRQRPLAVAALEDKIVQRAVVTLLNAIYEEDFLGFSCGFRPGRGTHDALDALCVGICRKKVSFILDADIRSFFDEISHDWLIRFLEHRIGDRRIIRLIQKWLKAGVLEDGVVMVSDRARPGPTEPCRYSRPTWRQRYGRCDAERELAPKSLDCCTSLSRRRDICCAGESDQRHCEIQSEVQSAASRLGLKLHVRHASSEREIEAVFENLAELRIGALVILTDPFFLARSDQFAALSLRHAIPRHFKSRVCGSWRADELWNGHQELDRQAGLYAGRILKGAKPADLPVQPTTKFELVINLKTAKDARPRGTAVSACPRRRGN